MEILESKNQRARRSHLNGWTEKEKTCEEQRTRETDMRNCKIYISMFVVCL